MQLYSLLNNIATILLIVYNILHYKQKKVILGDVSHRTVAYCASKRWPVLSTVGFWVILEILIISAAQYYLTGYFNMMLGKVLDTGANYFGNLFSAPVLVLLACVLLKIDFLAQMDLVTPAFPLALSLSKIACFPAGCCGGIEWEHGLYNPHTHRIEFPAQLLEAGVAFLLFIFLQCFKKKFKKGTVFPIYLIAFSATRFFTEFLRGEPNVLWGLKTYHFLCITGVVLGILEYLAACKYDVHMQKKSQNTHIAA